MSQHNTAFNENEKCLVSFVQAAHEHIQMENVLEVHIVIKRSSKYSGEFQINDQSPLDYKDQLLHSKLLLCHIQ